MILLCKGFLMGALMVNYLINSKKFQHSKRDAGFAEKPTFVNF